MSEHSAMFVGSNNNKLLSLMNTFTTGQEVKHAIHGIGTINTIYFQGGIEVEFEEGLVDVEENELEAADEVSAETVDTVDSLTYAITNGLTRHKGDFSRAHALQVVYDVATKGTGFAKDVATTVDKFQKASHKQARIIAAAFMTL